MKIKQNESLTQSIKAVIYGPSGAGKTSIIKTYDEQKYGKAILISAEAGLMSIRGHKVDIIDITLDDQDKPLPKEERFKRLVEAFQYVSTHPEYKTIFLDSITEVGQNCIEALKKEFTASQALPMWGAYGDRMRGITKAFRDLPNKNVIILGLSTIDKDEFQRRFTSIDLQGKIGDQLPQYFDEVLYLSIETTDKNETKRTLLTQTQNNIIAKDRSGKLDLKEEPNLTKIFDKILTTTQPTTTSKGNK